MSSRRKIYFVETKHTISLVLKFLAIASISFVAIGVSLFLLLDKRLGISYFDNVSTLTNLQESLPIILITTGVIQGIIWSTILFIVVLLWSHAISGPMVRYRRYLGIMEEGIPSDKMMFRSKDQLHNLAEIFREMQISCNLRKEDFASKMKKAGEIIEEYEEMLKGNCNEDELSIKATELKELYKNMQELFNTDIDITIKDSLC